MVKVCWSQSTGVSARVGSHVIWSPFAHNPCTQAQFSLPDTPPPPPTPPPPSRVLMQMKEMRLVEGLEHTVSFRRSKCVLCFKKGEAARDCG